MKPRSSAIIEAQRSYLVSIKREDDLLNFRYEVFDFRLFLLLLFSVSYFSPLLCCCKKEERRGEGRTAEDMGRAKLEMKYLDNTRARRTTYMARMKGVKKKAGELSLLCGVDVLVASVSPELNTVEFWPKKDTLEFRRIRERYICFRKKKNDINCESNGFGDEGNDNSEQQIPCLPMHSPFLGLPSFHEEMIAMEIKLKEVRERLCFLRACSHSENIIREHQEKEERLQAQFTNFMPSQEDLVHLHSIDQTSLFSQYLPLQFTDFNIPLQLDIHPYEKASPSVQSLISHQQPSPYAQSLPPYQQPSPFAHFLTSDLVDFNTMNPLVSFMPSDSSLWSHLDDLNWCNSLLMDYEFG